MNTDALDNLKKLTDNIKAGKSVVLLPPGIFTFVIFIFLLIIATVIFFSSVISIFAHDATTSFKAISQLTSLILLFIFIFLPSLMVFSGKKQFSFLSFYYAWGIFLLSLILLATGLLGYIDIGNKIIPLIISIITSLMSLIIFRSASYTLLKEFYYLLKCK